MDYDLLILGAGPGGYVAAIRAAQLGAKVGLIEERELGGTCLNRGCIPTKALVESVHVLSLARRGEEFGVACDNVRPDYIRMQARKDDVVKKLRGGVGMLMKKNKVDVIAGRGKLLDRNTIEVTGKDGASRVKSKNIILATGSEPLRLKGFPFDGENVITSDEALVQTEIPKTILIVGGGYIGAEWASIYSGLGAAVTVVEMMDQLLPRSDADVAKELLRALKKAKMKVHLGTKVESVKPGGKGVACKLSNGNDVTVEKVLVCVGRALNSADLGLEAAGVKTEKGAIVIDDQCRTSAPNVFAIGDVTAKLMLAHVASRQGIVAAEAAMGRDSRMDYGVVPACVFTNPEIASVGMTNAECAEEGIEAKEAKFPFAALGKAQALGETYGWVKIIAGAKHGEVLGVHIVGPHASDLIAEAALAMSMEATVEEIAHAIHAHPTLAESLMEASESWLGKGIHT